MTNGIIIFESHGRYSHLTFADDSMFDGIKERSSGEEGMKRYGMKYAAGRKGISDERIDEVSNNVDHLVNKLNNRETLDLEKELESICEH